MLCALEFDERKARIRFARTATDPAGTTHLQLVCEAELSLSGSIRRPSGSTSR